MLQGSPQFSKRYLACAIGYGFIRKAVQVWDAKTYDFSAREKIPMLLADKALLLSVSSFSSIYAWPLYAYWDVCNVERRLRNIKPLEKSHILDYIVS